VERDVEPAARGRRDAVQQALEGERVVAGGRVLATLSP